MRGSAKALRSSPGKNRARVAVGIGAGAAITTRGPVFTVSAAQDRVVLTGTGLADFAAAVQNLSVVNGNVVLTYGDGDTITVDGITNVNALTASHLIFE